VTVEVLLRSVRRSGVPAVRLGQSSLRYMRTLAQMVAHHTSNSNLMPGVSSQPAPFRIDQSSPGSLIEITEGGKLPLQLPNGESRTFLEDGDEIICAHSASGWCVGFGECDRRQHMKLHQFLFDQLYEHGVRQIFGIPGDFVLNLYNALQEDRRFRLITLGHEPAVGFAADGASRITNGLGVCPTYGAGGLNMINSIASPTPRIAGDGHLRQPRQARARGRAPRSP
jgi:hypothetical protein